MGKARAISLETRHFEKAGDATAFFSAMLQRYAIGDTLTDEDQADVGALLKRHDEMDDKVGCGVDRILVALSRAL